MSVATADTAPDVMADPKPERRHLIGFFIMVVGMFMAILDIQIVASSLSEIQAGLGAAPDEIGWVQSSYLIAEVIIIPLSGWLSQVMSTRWLFVISCGGFTLASFACAFAWSIESMIAFRVLQGFLGGAMIPTVFATAFILFQGPRRATMSVLIGLTATLAPTIGPTLGGLLTETFSWHWLFLINVPVGVLIVIVVGRTMAIDKGDRSLLARFDWLGLALMAAFLGSLEYVMEEGPRWNWLEDETIAAFAMVATFSGALFFYRAFTRDEPIVDLYAFANRNFAIGSLFSFLVGISLYGSVYIIPLFLGRIRGYNSLQIGETMFVTGAAMFLCAPIVGRLSQKLDTRVLLAVGLGILALALWLTAQLTAESGSAELMLPLALRGVGTMMAMVPVNQLALGTLPPARIKNASGLYNLMRNMGGAVGLALINTVVTERSAAHRQYLMESAGWGRSGATAWVDSVTAGLSARLGEVQAGVAALRRLSNLIQQQALILAYNDTLLLMAVFFVLALPLILLVRRPSAAGGGGGAH